MRHYLKGAVRIFPLVLILFTPSVPGYGQGPNRHDKVFTSHLRGESIAAISTGRFENQAVSFVGTVRQFAIEESPRKTLKLLVGSSGASIEVLSTRFQSLDLTRLVDSTVGIHGVAGAYRNRRGQFLGALVTADREDDIRLLEPGPRDPFDTPSQTLGELLTSVDRARGDHRIKITGVLTWYQPGHELYLQSGDDAVRVQTAASTPAQPGDLLDVVGFEVVDSSPHLTNGIFRKAAADGTASPPRVVRTTFADVVKEEIDARLVQIDGTVFDVVLRTGEILIVLQSGKDMIGAYLPAVRNEEFALQPGAKAQLTGVASLIFNEDHKPKSFSLRLRGPGDIRILQPAPWWTAKRALKVLAIAGSAILLIVFWVISLRKRVRAQTRLIRATLESTADAILVIDENGYPVDANRKFASLWRTDEGPADLDPGAAVITQIGPRLLDARSFGDLLTQADTKVRTGQATTVLMLRNGAVVECDYEQIQGSSGAGAVLSFRDITARRKSERLERDRNQILEAISREDRLGDVLPQICRTAEYQDDRIRCTIRLIENANPGTARRPPDRPDRGLARTIFRNGTDDDESYLGEVVAALSLTSPDGTELGNLVVTCRTPVAMDEDLKRIVATTAHLAGIAIEHRRLFDRLDYLAYHDPLTGRMNRGALDGELHRAIERARKAETTFGLLCIDLDRFKQINDTLSHRTGDQFICAVAERLSDMGTAFGGSIFRNGGDEFTVLLKTGSTLASSEEFAQKTLAKLREPFALGERMLHTTASIGISLFPSHGTTPAALQQAADSAMYKAKEGGKDQCRVFQGEWRIQEDGSFEMEALLRGAIESSSFEMHYQPKVDKSRRVRGLEALIRLRHPEDGLIPPDRFIAIAEDSGLIVQIGAWALDEVCRQIRAWRDQGLRPPRIAVNVSAAQFARGDFLETVRRILDRWRLPGDVLELEITESLLMKNIAEATELIRALTQLGVSFAIDDFGTGYSSLGYLHALPVSIMKIDRTFVTALDGPESTTPLVTIMVQLARSLGLGVVAEGVETEDQFRLLDRLGCDYFQGYLFCRPQPALRIEPLLQQRDGILPPCADLPDAGTMAHWPADRLFGTSGLVH
ncbi:MAG: EAL domain-containing protein [Acidobacteriota bacterium]